MESQPARHTITVGFLGTMALIGTAIVFMYATTYLSEQVWTILSAVLLLVVGLTFAWMMVGLKFEPFNMRRFLDSIVWTILSVGAIWLLNRASPYNLDVSPLSNQLFSTLMGSAEEAFFRVWMTGFINKVTRQPLLAVGVSSGIWTFYHMRRYGGSGVGVFMIIFVIGLFLGWVLLESKLADGVIFAHAIVNFLLTG